MTKESLHDKLSKLLRLAAQESGGTEQERDAAMAKAQEIAFKHNIDLMTIDVVADERDIFQSPAQMMEDWEGTLMGAVARVNFCRVGLYRVPKSRRHPYFIYGQKHNIDASKDLFDFLVTQVKQEILRETGRRDKRMQYARMVLQEVARDLLTTTYMQRVIEDNNAYYGAGPGTPFLSAGQRYVDVNHDAIIEAAALHLQGNEHLLKGNEGLKFIMDRTGLTPSYASEIRPYLKRGEYAPEIVKNMGVWRRSFEAAIVYTISGRLQEKFDSLVDDAGTSGQALVKVEDAALDDFDRDFKQQEETHKRYDPKGLAAGMESGKTVRLEELRQLRTARELNA